MKSLKLDEHEKEVQYISQVYRNCGILLAKILLKTKITPNTVTYTYIIVGLSAAILFAIARNRTAVITAAILAQLALILDRTDGSLARRKNITSRIMNWIDYNVDVLIDKAILFALALGYFIKTGNYLFLIFGATTIMLKDLIYNMNTALFVSTENTREIYEKAKKGIISQGIPTRALIYLSFLIFIIINQVLVYFTFMTMYLSIFYIASMIYLTKRIKNAKE